MTHLNELASRIIVLHGPLRSGTTLLRLLLGEHPQVTGGGENDYLFETAGGTSLVDGGSDAEREALHRAVAANRIPREQGIVPPDLKPVPDMIEDMIAQSMPAEGRLLLTLHRHTDRAAALLPGAAFVRLRRDPRDVAISSMKMGWAGNPYYGVDVWRQAERDWANAVTRIEGPVTELSFEALTAAPRDVLRRVLPDIGLPFDEAVLTPPSDSTYSAPTGGRSQAWKRTLTKREAGEIDWRARDVPDDGYYDRAPRQPSAMRRLQLFYENKTGRQAFAVRRYGLPLWLAEHATRRLPLPGRNRVRTLRTAIDIRHLK